MTVHSYQMFYENVLARVHSIQLRSVHLLLCDIKESKRNRERKRADLAISQ